MQHNDNIVYKKINVDDDDAAAADASGGYYYNYTNVICRSTQNSDPKNPCKQSKEIPNNVSQEDPDLSLIFESSIFTVTKAKKTKNLRSFTR